MSFDALKKNRANKLEELQKKLQETSNGGYEDRSEDGFWSPTVDSAGDGYAVVRFMPEPEGENSPYVLIHTHSFQDPTTKQWYIENCLTTPSIRQTDPVVEMNSKLWDTGDEEKKKQASRQKIKKYYVCNIYIVEDPAKPENEGKVLKWRMGKQVFDKLNEAMNPKYPDEKPMNPFDLWEGANFKVKIAKVEGYRSYVKSSFAERSALFDGDEEKLRQVYDKVTSLTEVVSPKNFKSYEELQARLHRVLGLSGSSKADLKKRAEDDDSSSVGSFHSKAKDPDPVKEEPVRKQVDEPVKATVNVNVNVDDEDDDLQYFAKLAAKK